MPSNFVNDRFCSKCGKSLIPLNTPHVSRDCDDCGKKIHVVETGESGKGIKVRAGDRFTIPAGFIKLSLDPSKGGTLHKHGVQFLVKKFLTEGLPKSSDNLPELLEYYDKKADEVLKSYDKLSKLDLDDEDDGQRAYEILKENQNSREWYAMLLGSFCEIVQESLDKGDIEKSTWAMAHATVCHSLTVVTETTFEQTLWRGYLANQTVYEAATAASKTPGEAEAIKELKKLFDNLDEATLHTYVESGLPIGPRIGVTKIPEPLILGLAKFHLASYQRKREEQQREIEREKFNREMKIKWCTIGIGVAGVVVTILKAVGVL